MIQNQIANQICYRSCTGKGFAAKFQYCMLQRYNAYVFPMLKFYHLLERNDIRRKRGSFSLFGIIRERMVKFPFTQETGNYLSEGLIVSLSHISTSGIVQPYIIQARPPRPHNSTFMDFHSVRRLQRWNSWTSI
jgi:hypothetical protein